MRGKQPCAAWTTAQNGDTECRQIPATNDYRYTYDLVASSINERSSTLEQRVVGFQAVPGHRQRA